MTPIERTRTVVAEGRVATVSSELRAQFVVGESRRVVVPAEVSI